MSIWDLAKPVIAQVHGYCLAGGSELATGCDLVYVAEDAKIGYPAVRFGVPDMHFHAWFLGMRTAMEMMLTGDSISGVEAVRARLGQPGVSRPTSSTTRCSRSPSASRRSRPTSCSSTSASCTARWRSWACAPAIRAGTELCALGTHTESMKKFVSGIQSSGLRAALDERDTPFGDYRTSEPHDA